MKFIDFYFENNLDIIFIQFFCSMLFNLFFSNSKKFKLSIVFLLTILLLLTSVIYSFFGLSTILLNWLFFTVYNLITITEIKLSMSISSLSILLIILSDYIATRIKIPSFILNFINNNIRIESYIHLGISLFVFLILVIMVNFIKDNVKKNKALNLINSIFLVFVFTAYYIFVYIEEFSLSKKKEYIFFIIYIIISIFIFITTLYIIKKNLISQQRENELKSLELYTIELERSYTEMRKFKHDYQNILVSLENYIEDGDINLLKEYFTKNIKPTSNLISNNCFKLHQLSNIKVKEIKSILFSKLMYSQDLGIDTSFESP